MSGAHRKILITGASGEVGAGVLPFLAQQGYQIIACHRRSLPPPLVTHCVATASISLEDEGACESILTPLCAAHAPVTGAVMLAGGFAMGDFEATKWVAMEAMLTMNFKTAYTAARCIFLEMKKRGHGGHFIFVGARIAFPPEQGSFAMAYALSKGLLLPLAQHINIAGKAHGITANVLAPGVIDTPSNRASMPTAAFNEWVQPEEIGTHIHRLFQEPASQSTPLIKLWS